VIIKFFLTCQIFICSLIFSQKKTICYLTQTGKKDTIKLKEIEKIVIEKEICEACSYFKKDEILLCDKIELKDSTLKVYLSTTNDIIFKVKLNKNKEKKFSKLYKFNKEIRKILNKLENSGYPFAEIYLDSLIFDEKNLELIYKVKENEFIVYDTIDIIGKKVINKKFLSSYLGIKEGKAYQEKKIKDINKGISQLRFLKFKDSTKVFFMNNKSIIRTYLEKGNQQLFNGIVGASKTEDKVSIIGEINLFIYNLFSRAENINFYWKSLIQSSQTLNFSFNLPYIFNYPIGIQLKYFSEKKDTLFVTNQILYTLFFYYKHFNSINFSYGKTKSNTSRTYNDYGSFNAYTYKISFNYTTIEELLPKKGVNYEFNFSFNSIKYRDLQKKENRILEANIVNIIPIKKFFSLKLQFTMHNNNYYRYKNELQRIGGYNSLRGFDEEAFLVKYYYLAKLEPRFIITPKNHIYPLFDYCLFKTNRKENAKGVGFGIETLTKNGVLFLNYAVGTISGWKFNLTNIKIHIGYKSIF